MLPFFISFFKGKLYFICYMLMYNGTITFYFIKNYLHLVSIFFSDLQWKIYTIGYSDRNMWRKCGKKTSEVLIVTPKNARSVTMIQTVCVFPLILSFLLRSCHADGGLNTSLLFQPTAIPLTPERPLTPVSRRKGDKIIAFSPTAFFHPQLFCIFRIQIINCTFLVNS